MGTTPGKIRRKWLLAAAVVAAAGTGAAVCINVWILGSTRARVLRRIDDVPRRTVAIVPGARVYRGGVPSAALEDRLKTALDLYQSGRVGKVLVSGDHNTPEYDEVNAMQRWMREHGVPDRDVFLDHAGLRTRDTMQRAARVFQVRDAVVCTQAFHLPRAVFLAREAGIDAVGLEADRRPYRSAVKDGVREVVSRTVAGLEALVFKTEPRFLGPPIPIDGDATATHDAWTTGKGDSPL